MAARVGMADLITRVRQLSNVGTGDYTIAATTYWSDDHVQALLDENRMEVYDELLTSIRQLDSGGTARYYDFHSAYTNYERTTGGTAVFYIRDSQGARLGTADYTADYANGVIVFGPDQAGSARYVTGRSYDVYGAAAMVWEAKAAQVADRFDFRADGAQFDVSQLVKQYEMQAKRMWARSTMGGIGSTRMERSDVKPNQYTDVVPAKVRFDV
jgi:hypothetical protein